MTIITKSGANLKDLLMTIKKHTRPLVEHPDPKSIEDCWNEVFDTPLLDCAKVKCLFNDCSNFSNGNCFRAVREGITISRLTNGRTFCLNYDPLPYEKLFLGDFNGGKTTDRVEYRNVVPKAHIPTYNKPESKSTDLILTGVLSILGITKLDEQKEREIKEQIAAMLNELNG